MSKFFPVLLCREDKGTNAASEFMTIIYGTDPGVLVNQCQGVEGSSCLLATNLYLFFPC